IPLGKTPDRHRQSIRPIVAICRRVWGGAVKVGDIITRIERYLLLPGWRGSSWITTLAATAGIAIAYFLAARLGLALRPQPVKLAVFWPASGVAAGALLAGGRRAALPVGLGVIAGGLAAIMPNNRGFLETTLLGICNFGEVAILAWLLPWWLKGPFAFRDVRV